VQPGAQRLGRLADGRPRSHRRRDRSPAGAAVTDHPRRRLRPVWIRSRKRTSIMFSGKSAVSANSAFPLACFIVVPIFMIVEARRAATNERAQRSRGGIEPSDDVYQLMQIAYPGIFIVMLAEGAVRGVVVTGMWFASGLTIFIAAKMLKWWAIS